MCPRPPTSYIAKNLLIGGSYLAAFFAAASASATRAPRSVFSKPWGRPRRQCQGTVESCQILRYSAIVSRTLVSASAMAPITSGPNRTHSMSVGR
jgi:hypothetical protein